MTEPFTSTATTAMMLPKKLEVLRYIFDGHNIAQTAKNFDIDCEIVKRIVDQRARLEKVPMKLEQRNNLKLREKDSAGLLCGIWI